jgi:predicted Zn-dependent protease
MQWCCQVRECTLSDPCSLLGCCLGGKVLVFTGILPVMEDEDGMATVLAHEIGHVVASIKN